MNEAHVSDRYKHIIPCCVSSGLEDVFSAQTPLIDNQILVIMCCCISTGDACFQDVSQSSELVFAVSAVSWLTVPVFVV